MTFVEKIKPTANQLNAVIQNLLGFSVEKSKTRLALKN